MLRAKNANPVISYKNLRRLVGILGMVLPLVCFLGGKLFGHLPIQRSLSYYYYTNVRDIVVGVLVSVGVFLITYNGYEKIDSLVCKTTGIAGLTAAVFPCLFEEAPLVPVGFFQLLPKVSNIVHLIAAVLFFVLLAVNSLFIFTLSNNRKGMTKNKKIRNGIYIACGLLILLSLLALLIVYLTVDPAVRTEKHLIFIFETIMLEAFGISWLVKGATFFKD